MTSYDLKKVDEMLDYYEKKGCEVKPLLTYMNDAVHSVKLPMTNK